MSLICAIEAGRIEAQTLLMLRSLRRFGGALAKAPVTAFQGRRGAPLAAGTRQALDELGATYVYRPDLNRAPWFNYSNKIAAVTYAEAHFDTPWRLWLDSDVLFLDSPGFAQDAALEEADFHARFECMPPAVTTDAATHSAYWTRLCALDGVEFDSLPLHDLNIPATRMKPLFNSGVFLWRAGTGFASAYADSYYRLLDARIAPRGMGPWFADQLVLTPVLERLKLRWRMLGAEDHLMLFAHTLGHPDLRAVMPRANLVHYSRARTPPHKDDFDRLVLGRRPELEPLLHHHDHETSPATASLAERLIRYGRAMRQKAYARRCTAL